MFKKTCVSNVRYVHTYVKFETNFPPSFPPLPCCHHIIRLYVCEYFSKIIHMASQKNFVVKLLI